ncbi:MAG: lamin tail domain-containing protein, partial [Bacteroidota bacterium]|nr:lamin tail domain-containing protein [Bacteroidota bacterium]
MKKILLAILSLGSVTFVNAQCSELFISEYVEGSSHSKAIEIYNPTANPIALSNYKLIRYSNGSPTPVDSLNLTGTIQPYDVWVVVNGQATPDVNGAFCDPALLAMADQVGPPQYNSGGGPNVLYFNGDDAIALIRISPFALIDI